MDLPWSKIEALQGHTLHTQAKGSPFEIVDVLKEGGTAIRVRAKSLIPRNISRKVLTQSYDLWARGELSRPSDFGDHGIKTKNASYVLAILEAIGGERGLR
jgi:hypothetical protein